MHTFSRMNSAVKVLTKVRGQKRLFLECDQRRDQAIIKALKIYFRKFCRKSKTRNFNLDFYLNNSDGSCPVPLLFFSLPLKWLILRQNETQRTRLGLPSISDWVFYPYPQSCTDGLTTGVSWRHNQIFWRRYVFIFYRYGASRTRTLRYYYKST